MNKDARIYVAGHRGLVGSALVGCLEKKGFSNLITRTHSELDLTDQASVNQFFVEEKPEYVFLAAAKVGGIMANYSYPAEFIYKNLMIAANVIHASYRSGVKKLLNLGSSCIYPKLSPQPLKEEYLLTGALEPTNEAYAIAKIAAIKLCRYYNDQFGTNYMSVMPTNLYGPNDNFDLETSHVLPALVRKFIEAKRDGIDTVILWGSGRPMREFLFVDDMADACVHLMTFDGAPVSPECMYNIGTGKDLTIKDLAELVARIVRYEGAIGWDKTKPDGTPRKVLDVSRMQQMGWFASTSIEEGVYRTIDWYQSNCVLP